MLLDMHAHTSGISWCCRAGAETIVRIAKDAGIDGIVLTNHYQSLYIDDGDSLAFEKKYYEEFEYTRKCGQDVGLKVLFGLEVTAEKHKNAHLLIYGVGKDFVLKYSDIYSYPQEKIYSVVKEAGGLLIWAHPFRGGFNDTISLDFLDGVEVNCHPKYGSTYIKEVFDLARANGLKVTCGGDYHHDTPYRPYCGTYFDKDVADETALVSYLKTADDMEILVQEPDAKTSTRVRFVK